MEPIRDSVVRLKDGRGIGVAEYGDPAGLPLFYFHGFPSCRLEPAVSHESAARSGIRIIAMDRPGIGNSEPAPHQTVARAVNDVTATADAMDIGEFAVLGGSGGGPYALACARKFPERLHSATVVSGFGRIARPGVTRGMRTENRLAFRSARSLPFVSSIAMRTMARTVRNDPDSAIRQTARAMGGDDRAVILQPDNFGALKSTMIEAFRAGPAGQVADMNRIVRPWRFRVENIRMPVTLWQGTDDHLVTVAMARDIADALPDCRSHFVEGEGHLLALNRVDDILAAVKER